MIIGTHITDTDMFGERGICKRSADSVPVIYLSPVSAILNKGAQPRAIRKASKAQDNILEIGLQHPNSAKLDNCPKPCIVFGLHDGCRG
jgi:hypothetical protein